MDQAIPNSLDFKKITNKDSYFQAVTIFGTQAQTAGNYGYIFTARTYGLEIIGISEKHEVAGTDVGAVTLDVRKVPNGVAIASGTTLLLAGATFNLKATANTTVYKEGKDLSLLNDSRIIKPFDSVGVVVSGTLTSLQGVCVTVYYRWANRGSYR